MSRAGVVRPKASSRYAKCLHRPIFIINQQYTKYEIQSINFDLDISTCVHQVDMIRCFFRSGWEILEKPCNPDISTLSVSLCNPAISNLLNLPSDDIDAILSKQYSKATCLFLVISLVIPLKNSREFTDILASFHEVMTSILFTA